MKPKSLQWSNNRAGTLHENICQARREKFIFLSQVFVHVQNLHWLVDKMFNFWELKINKQTKSRSWSSVTQRIVNTCKITINHNKIITNLRQCYYIIKLTRNTTTKYWGNLNSFTAKRIQFRFHLYYSNISRKRRKWFGYCNFITSFKLILIIKI